MLTLRRGPDGRTCDGMSRRSFLSVGSLAGVGLTLPTLLASRAHAEQHGRPVKNTSVVMVWLSGGPTHVETLNPLDNAPSEFRGPLDSIGTAVPGVRIGQFFPELAKTFDKAVAVRSFTHSQNGHSGATHWVMTGVDNRLSDNGAPQSRPSWGAITAKVRGPNHPTTKMPTFVQLRRSIYANGPSFLGVAHAPFETSGPARQNMDFHKDVAAPRLDDRRHLLMTFDRVRRDLDRSGLMDGMDALNRQAFELVAGAGKEAFDISKEPQHVRDRYGDTGIGQDLLAARRLCEAGAGFVTVDYGGGAWDMHGQIVNGLRNQCPPLDKALAAFIGDCHERGLDEQVLLIVTGEFGRTPRINQGAGRDHWGDAGMLLLAGGGLRMGQVIGATDQKGMRPISDAFTPEDLGAIIFHVLGIDKGVHYPDQFGRPQPMLYNGKVHSALI